MPAGPLYTQLKQYHIVIITQEIGEKFFFLLVLYCGSFKLNQFLRRVDIMRAQITFYKGHGSSIHDEMEENKNKTKNRSKKNIVWYIQEEEEEEKKRDLKMFDV